MCGSILAGMVIKSEMKWSILHHVKGYIRDVKVITCKKYVKIKVNDN